MSPVAHAQGQDGSFFLRLCTQTVKQSDGAKLTEEEGIGSLYCIAYISGFMDGSSLTSTFDAGKKTICLPAKGVTNDQAARVFVKYLRENPESLHESGRMSFYVSLVKIFPCGN
jgi:hypothetical protein